MQFVHLGVEEKYPGCVKAENTGNFLDHLPQYGLKVQGLVNRGRHVVQS